MLSAATSTINKSQFIEDRGRRFNIVKLAKQAFSTILVVKY